MAHKGYSNVPPIPQGHSSLQTTQVSCLHATSNKIWGCEFCSQKTWSYSSFPASKIVHSPHQPAPGAAKGHDVALHTHSIGNKGIQITAPITSLLKLLQCFPAEGYNPWLVIRGILYSLPWTSLLPLYPAAPYPAPSCQWWILALCYPIPLDRVSLPHPSLNSSWAARHILFFLGLATEGSPPPPLSSHLSTPCSQGM